METLRHDVRYALRTLAKAPAFTLIAVAVLALGIGANSAIFSVVYGVLIRPLPYKDADRLLMTNVSLPEYQDIRETVTAFDSVTVWASNLYNIDVGGDVEQIRGALVTPTLLSMLGGPLLGRTFQPEDDRAPVVVLSFDLWLQQFGGDPAVIGRTINLSRQDFTVIGVMPQAFEFPTPEMKLWVPLGLAMSAAPEQTRNRSLRIFRVVARLKPGVTLSQAQSETDTLSARLQKEFPATNSEFQIRWVSVPDRLVGNVRLPLLVLLAIVGAILLIACANITNLMLVRGAAREREIAIRTALGAGWKRVARQLVTESVLLAAGGGSVGLLLALWSVDLLRALSPANLPRLNEIGVNMPVLFFTAGCALVSALIFGLTPAVKASRIDVEQILKDTGRHSVSSWSRRLRSGLVVAEIALSLIVLVAAGLLLTSFDRLTRVNVGFRPENLLVTNVELRHYREPQQRANVAREVLAKISAVPGVEAVGGSSALPPVEAQRVTSFSVPGSTENRQAYFIGISPDYFRAIRAPVIQGRSFNERDTVTAPLAVIVNETFARGLFSGENPIGKQIRLINPEQSDALRTIVGVAADVKYSGLDDENFPTIYTPFAQTPFLWSYILIRTSVPPAVVMAGVRESFAAVDPNARPRRLELVTDLISDSVAQPRFNTILLAAFAILALALAVTGLYGVVSYVVTQQTRDIGIRIALGADTGDVFRLTLGSAAKMIFAGLILGIAGALAVTRLMTGLLFEVDASDPATYAAVAVILFTVAMTAAYIPARRASRIDPMTALRHD